MKFVSSCYWQQGENSSTLLLQQCRVRDTAVVFACVCAGENEKVGKAGNYLAKQLMSWFRGLELVRAVRKPERFLDRQKPNLEQLIGRTDEELAMSVGRSGKACAEPENVGTENAGVDNSEKVSLAGIFCVGKECLIFGRGNAQLRLLNRSMGRACADVFKEFGEELYIGQGILEKDVGILLAVGSLENNSFADIVREGLAVEGILTERQAEQHLKEVGDMCGKAGGRNMAAVLVLARTGG